MQATVTRQSAMRELRDTGRVRLPGRPALWSRWTRGLTLVLLIMIGVAGCAGLVTVIVAAVNGSSRITAATVVGMAMVAAMLAGLVALVLWWRRSLSRHVGVEHSPVVLEASGLTLRGVGPIPWRDFGPARNMMVRAEYSSGWTLRAVMPLTPSGLVNVNERTSAHLRRRISPSTGPAWNRGHRWIYVPGVEGMRQADVMQLINVAHQMFGHPSRTQR
ncbi:hypothetical protein [Janibacter cremeus]|uniref:Uncharacterized protein n=2 Tax=Actinomycetes TaxID=1760 RepID=A0A852VS92_9MICO|nr:hypothetical protein [Janibacter cremeus]NYF97563.1 hypothetical protein [Janibacter cremeus]